MSATPTTSSVVREKLQQRGLADARRAEREAQVSEDALYSATDLLARVGVLTMNSHGKMVVLHNWLDESGQSYTLTRGFQEGGPNNGYPNGYVNFAVTNLIGTVSYDLGKTGCYPSATTGHGSKDLLGFSGYDRATSIDDLCRTQLDHLHERYQQERGVGEAATATIVAVQG